MPRPHTFSSPQRKAQYRKKILIKVSILFAIIGALAFGGVYSLHASFWSITTVDVAGNEAEETTTIAEHVKNIITEKSFFVFPKDNILIVPLKAIEAGILDAFPRIKEVESKRTSLVSIEIIVTERKAHALWCLEGGSCYYIDDVATGYALAPDFSDAVYVKYIKEGTAEAPIRSLLLPAITYTHLGELVAFLNAKGYAIAHVKISKDEKEAFLFLKDGPEIRISPEDNLTQLAGVITTVLSSEPLVSTDLSSIAYLDMRFGKKIYYRFVGESAQESTATLPNEE